MPKLKPTSRTTPADAGPIRNLADRLLSETLTRPGPAIFLLCGAIPGQGVSTVAAAVAKVLADSRRVVLACVAADGARVTWPPPPQAGGGADAESRGAAGCRRIDVPHHVSEFADAARNPGAWVDAFDIMIIDAPDLTHFITRSLAPTVSGVVLVAQGEKTSVGKVVKARDDLAQMKARLTGVVLNRHRAYIPRALERSLL